METYRTLKEYIASAEARSEKSDPPGWLPDLIELVGSSAVGVDSTVIERYSYDTWPVATKWQNQGKQLFPPEAVVHVSSTEQVRALLLWANERRVPVIPWGAGSSVTGQGLAVCGGVVLDLLPMKRILALDEVSLVVKVQAGIYGHILEQELNSRGYTLNHSPQSLDRSTAGGWVATRAMGQFSSKYGGIEDLVVGFTVVLPTGEVVETMNVPRASVGPDLRHVFMGGEGTMGVITEVSLKIFPLQENQIFESVVFDSIESGLSVMRQITRLGLRPFLIRLYDADEARHAMQDPSFSSCVMFLGFDGPLAVAEAEYRVALDLCAETGGEAIGPEPVKSWMERRFDFTTVEKLLAQPGGLAETIEVAHFWDSIEEMYVELKSALAPFADEVLGHFSHVYPQGTSLYLILLGKAGSDAAAEAQLLRVWDTAMQICLKHGGAISHHHGAGLARLPYVADSLGSSAIILQKLKQTLDPAGIMNPGKLIGG
jgi:alkyldihydroxyacetonephosphate synthase